MNAMGPEFDRPGHEADKAEPMKVSNEFAQVLVTRVHTRNGVRLEIRSPRLGRAIRLCPLELETLTWQDQTTFSRFLAAPFGPEPEADR